MILREANRDDLFSIARVQVDSNRSTYIGIMPDNYLNNLSYESKANEWDEKLFSETSTQFMYVVETFDGNIVAKRIIDRGGKALQQIAFAWEDITGIF